MKRRAIFIVAALASLGVARAVPAGIGVSPVLVDIPAERGVGSLRIDNGRGVATAFEVDVYRWTQRDGEDVLAPAHDVAVAPSVFEVPAGGRQIVRIAIAPQARPTDREAAWRLMVRELPPVVRVANGPTILLEMSVPVFAAPREARARLAAEDVGAGALMLSNVGIAHARLLEVGPAGRTARDAPRYLLAGAAVTRRFPLTGGALRVVAVDANAVEAREQVIPVVATFAVRDPVLRGR